MDDLTGRIKKRACDEGFDLVGVAPVAAGGPSPALDRWIAQGMHGEMGYMERTRSVRSDPRHLLPGCRSIVAVAMSYRSSAPPSTTVPKADQRVWVSRYAWGRDYHRIFKKRLVRLGRWLAERRPGCGWRACVDTAPILEREWAARAGLGWIGKNTMLLNRALGSELFLGLLLTDLELDAGPAGARTLRHLHRLSRSLPDPGVSRASRARRQTLRRLPDRGTPIGNTGRIRLRGGVHDRRLRYLSGGLPMDPQIATRSPLRICTTPRSVSTPPHRSRGDGGGRLPGMETRQPAQPHFIRTVPQKPGGCAPQSGRTRSGMSSSTS